MEVTTEWVGAVLTLMGMSGAIGVWWQERRHKSRAAMPIIRTSWNVGECGFTVAVKIVNRLNEDVYVTTAECLSSFKVTKYGEYDPAKGTAEVSCTPQQSPMALDWLVPSLADSSETFTVDGANTRRWLCLTISSSAGTLRRKRLIVEQR